MDKPTTVDRRKFLGALGVTVGGTGLAGAGLVAGPQLVKAATEPPKGKIPDTPFRTGHMTFFTSPAAVLGEPSHKGHILAAEEINAQGGLLGKRKIETITADEAAGTDANVIQLSRDGVATGLIGIPNRYMHSAVEVVCLEDLERSARLLAEFCLNVTSQTDWTP